MYEIIKNYIKTETYNLDDLTRKIDKMFIEDKLTEAERDELILLATENARDSAQVDLFNKIVDLEHRIVILESAMNTEPEPEPVPEPPFPPLLPPLPAEELPVGL